MSSACNISSSFGCDNLATVWSFMRLLDSGVASESHDVRNRKTHNVRDVELVSSHPQDDTVAEMA